MPRRSTTKALLPSVADGLSRDVLARSVGVRHGDGREAEEDESSIKEGG